MSTLSIASRSRQKVLGYPVDIVTDALALEIIEEAWRMNKGLHIVTLNAEMVIAAQRDQDLDRIIRHAHLIIPDGSGVVWALRLAGSEVDRLPGIELATITLSKAAAAGKRVALLGGKSEVVTKLQSTLPQQHPGLNIVAAQNGYFDGEDEEAIVAALAETAPDLILVALGVPKQEYFIDRWHSAFSKTVMIGVGGSFDVWAGNVKRAPAGFRKAHLEWLYRLICEPWRFKRMSQALPNFALQVAKELAYGKLQHENAHGKKAGGSRTKRHDKSKERSKDNK